MKNNIYFILLLFSSLSLSITLKIKKQDLNCADVKTFISQLKGIESNIEKIRVSFEKTYTTYANTNSKDDVKLTEIKQNLIKIAEKDIRNIKLLKEIFTDISSSLKDSKSKLCDVSDAEKTIIKVKENMKSLIQEMKTKVKDVDSEGKLTNSIIMIELF